MRSGRFDHIDPIAGDISDDRYRRAVDPATDGRQQWRRERDARAMRP